MKYIIQDWAGNHLFQDKVFDSYKEGWEYIYANVQEETENNRTYDDYYIVPQKKINHYHKSLIKGFDIQNKSQKL